METTRHFRLLAGAAEIGGAGNMSLDALVKEIHEKYTQAMSDFFSVVENVLSIDGSQNFERTFFTFRTIVKVGAENGVRKTTVLVSELATQDMLYIYIK